MEGIAKGRQAWRELVKCLKCRMIRIKRKIKDEEKEEEDAKMTRT